MELVSKRPLENHDCEPRSCGVRVSVGVNFGRLTWVPNSAYMSQTCWRIRSRSYPHWRAASSSSTPRRRTGRNIAPLKHCGVPRRH